MNYTTQQAARRKEIKDENLLSLAANMRLHFSYPEIATKLRAQGLGYDAIKALIIEVSRMELIELRRN